MLAADGADNAVDHCAMAPVYGMASTIPMRGLVSDMLKEYLDLIFKV